MSVLRAAIALALGLAPAAAFAADAADLATKLGALAAFSGVAISPDGSKISYLNTVAGNARVVVVVDLETRKKHMAAGSKDAATRISWCDWIKADRLACAVGAERRIYGEDIGVSRLFAMDADGSNMVELSARKSSRSYGIDNYGGSIIDYLPDDPDNVLMQVYKLPERSPVTRAADIDGGMSVVRVDVRTGRSRPVEPPSEDVEVYRSDRFGHVRLRALESQKQLDGGTYASGRYRWFYRTKADDRWLPLGISDVRDYNTLEVGGFDETGDNILVMKPKDGRQALFKIAADGSNRETLVFAHDEVDVGSVARIGRHLRPIGVTFSTDYNHIHYFDTALAKLAERLGRALPGQPQVGVIDESWDGSKLLLFAGTDADPGTYYWFNKETRELNELFRARPEVEGLTFSETKPISYPAKDGASIPAYLTLPPGKADAKGLPAIVMPHGGPSSRDTWGFDWLVQYFSQLGYAVLQPNYRGSSGYGEEWFRDNGFRGWRTSIGDINDGARWLVAQGVADPRKLAIFGWSYGGYAALQANVAKPDLYRAIVAVAPVTDLAALKDQDRHLDSFLIDSDFIGTGAHLTEGSPAKNAAAIKAPVMMFHGAKDLNVDVRQSRAMESALKQANKSVELIVYPELQHSLIDSGARADMLLRSAKFFAANLD